MNSVKSVEFKPGRLLLSAIAIAILATFVISGPIQAQEDTQMNTDCPRLPCQMALPTYIFSRTRSRRSSPKSIPKLMHSEWMAATQRQVTDVALNEASREPVWKSVPSWFIYGDADLIIPPELLAYMVHRANSLNTVVIEGASHVAMMTHPDKVADLIKNAAIEVAAGFEAIG